MEVQICVRIKVYVEKQKGRVKTFLFCCLPYKKNPVFSRDSGVFICYTEDTFLMYLSLCYYRVSILLLTDTNADKLTKEKTPKNRGFLHVCNVLELSLW